VQNANLPSGQPRIAQIQTPTLILWGDHDPLIPVEHARFFDRDLPNATLIVYEGVDHMPQLEIPERSANDTRAFLLTAAKPVEPTEPAKPPVEPTAPAAK
jgi:pimeloyl-ACP methyl ester carboxylesterase